MTIKDIAKQCSVSVSTVSRVLNDRPDVSDEVRRKVRAAIKDSNYIPNNRVHWAGGPRRIQSVLHGHHSGH